MKKTALLLALATLAAAAHAQLSETEQRIVAAIKQRGQAPVQLLEKVARINSGTLNHEGVREVGQVFRAEFEGLGFQTRWVDVKPEVDRAGHLAAEHTGTQGKRLLLLGHMDTVFEKTSSVNKWEPQGDRIKGQGVSDMKGGDVIMLEALRALKAVGALDSARITVLLTGDEERIGFPIEKSRAAMVDLAKRSDLALSFEGFGKGADGVGLATAARRSSTAMEIEVQAESSHSSRIFEKTYGAVFEGSRILNAFREQLIQKNVTFNAGLVVGGMNVSVNDATATGTALGKTNVVPGSMTIQGDLRVLTPELEAQVRKRMQDIVTTGNLPGTKARIVFKDRYPAMAPTQENLQLLAQFSKASEDAGLGAVRARDPSNSGGGDVQFTAPYVPGLDGLGASGNGAHTDDEYLDVASLEQGAIRAAILLYRLTRP